MRKSEAPVLNLNACLIALAVWALPAAAKPVGDYEHDNTRGLLESTYVDQYQQQPAVYQTTPVNLIVPIFKNVTFALAGADYLVKMKSADFGNYGISPNAEQRLNLTGYTVAPYIAVSLHRIGLGFSAERGARKLEYYLDDATQPNNLAVPFARRQESSMEYNAVGVYLYLLPFESGPDRTIIASLVVGAKDYNVTHYVSPITPANEALVAEKFRYTLTQYEVGTLVEYRILKRFALIPWVDYNYIDIHDPINQANAVINQTAGGAGNVDVAYNLKGDTMMFWRARPQLNIGLDMALTIEGVTIHFGDAFGYLVSSRNNQNISDQSYTLSFSVNMKAD